MTNISNPKMNNTQITNTKISGSKIGVSQNHDKEDAVKADTQQTDFHDLHFDSIQTLRGIAAVLVVMEHIRFLACGAFGVDIFFCISGFMIMFTTHKNTDYFFRKRLLRILPFYYLMTIGTFGLVNLFPSMFEQTHASLGQLAKSLLFIPFDMGGGVLQPLLRIGWTINCEMFFYLLFGISYHISRRYRGLVCSLLLLLCTVIGAFTSGGCTITGESLLAAQPGWLVKILPAASDAAISTQAAVSPWLAPIFFYGSPVMLEFALGILCYYLARLLYQRLRPAASAFSSRSITCRGILFLAAGFLLLAGMLLSTFDINILGFRRPLYWGIPAMLAVLAFFAAGIYLSMPSFSVKLGDMSFSLYLIHYYPIMFLDRKVFDFSTLTPLSALGALIGILLVILAGRIAWYLIEVRFSGWLRKRLLPPRTKTPV